MIGSEGGNGKVICFGGSRVAQVTSESDLPKADVATNKPTATIESQPDVPKTVPKVNQAEPSPKEYGPKDWAGWFVNQVSYRKQKESALRLQLKDLVV